MTPASDGISEQQRERRLIEAAEVEERQLRELALTARPPILPSADSFPGYEIVREIFRGGQGVVYQASQKATGRRVAIKVMREGPFADARAFEPLVQVLIRDGVQVGDQPSLGAFVGKDFRKNAVLQAVEWSTPYRLGERKKLTPPIKIADRRHIFNCGTIRPKPQVYFLTISIVVILSPAAIFSTTSMPFRVWPKTV